ncbi:MAG TPA: hypothetical protein VII56_07680 [Rhizomicrobium sp.]
MDTNDGVAVQPAAARAVIDWRTVALASAAGLAAAVAGAALWAVVTVLSEYELGIMAVAVGFMVGKAIMAVAKSAQRIYGIVGAACSLLGCLLGNLLSAVGYAAPVFKVSYVVLLTHLNIDLAGQLMSATFGFMDLLFYAIAIYEGYRFATRR